jgi:hypothetical protein
MQNNKKLRRTYVASDDLYCWVGDYFESFDDWLDFESEYAESIEKWEQERTFRIIESAKSGLINEVIKGNASAVSQLKSLLGIQRPVGRPKGTTNLTDEHKEALDVRLIEEFNQDVARLNSN